MTDGTSAEGTSGASAPAPASKKRVRKRILVPLVLLGLLLLCLLGAVVRGTWSDTVEKSPVSADEGPITQLYRTPEGRTVVRSAIVLDVPPKEAWAVVSDYAAHSAFLPSVSALRVTPEPDGVIHLQGTLHSGLWGDWPFEEHVRSKEAPDKNEYESWWEDAHDDFTVNRGRWTVRPAGEGKSLVTLTLDMEVKQLPTFLVRNILMDRLPAILDGVRKEARRRRK